MAWIKVLPQSELPEGARQVVSVKEQPILLFWAKHQIHAVSNRCPHLRLPLLKAKIIDDESTLVCPWHHSAFDVDSGDVKAWSPWPPMVGKMLGCLTREKALPVFQTKVESGSIWIDI